MNDRHHMLRLISDRLGDRELYWAGLRSDDVEPASDLPQLAASFSIMGGYGRASAIESIDFEHIWGSRVDADSWDIDDHLRDSRTIEFRDEILRASLVQSAIVPYRPTRFLSSIIFSRLDRCLYLGLFSEHQAAFDHKPWVESRMADLGLPHLNWTYIADDERRRVSAMLTEGPIVVRPSRSSGGEGLMTVSDPSELDEAWPRQTDSYASVARYLPDALPVNIGATVWRDGAVTVSHPSVQLIGLLQCTSKPFGYCGNDFGAVRQLEQSTVDAMEASTKAIGQWLWSHGYLGTFGVDYLVHQGKPLFAEINPRFQGSTHLSCQISAAHDSSCLILDHLAAFLGIEAPRRPPLSEVVATMPTLSHFVVHWKGPAWNVDSLALAHKFRQTPGHVRSDVQAHPTGILEPGGVVVRETVAMSITNTGFDLVDPWAAALTDWKASVS